MQKILSAFILLALSTGAFGETAALLVYRVWEKGSDPYLSRVMVTPDYVRLDEGIDDGGYTLFDRQQEILYNVSPDDRSILVIDHSTPVPEDAAKLVLKEEVAVDEQAPSVAGRQPTDVRLLANGELCSEMVVIDGVMQEAVDALAELKLALARIQAATLPSLPPEMRTPCDLAANVYAADRSLRFGLPLQERSAGRSQSLVDFKSDYEAAEGLFTLPSDFDRRPMFAPAAI